MTVIDHMPTVFLKTREVEVKYLLEMHFQNQYMSVV